MTTNRIIKISGMLNQHEFKERYIFTMQRIANNFSRQELAFLLGKSTYDIVDYEQLCMQVKMNFRDHEVMAELFKNPAPPVPVFNSKIDNTDISNEKRMIRGTVVETDLERQIKFIHPWTIKGESKSITVSEDMDRCADQDLKILEWVSDHIAKLKEIGCFSTGCTSMFLYQQLNSIISTAWKPFFVQILSKIVYAHVRSGEFQIYYEDGQVFYKIKK